MLGPCVVAMACDNGLVNRWPQIYFPDCPRVLCIWNIGGHIFLLELPVRPSPFLTCSVGLFLGIPFESCWMFSPKRFGGCRFSLPLMWDERHYVLSGSAQRGPAHILLRALQTPTTRGRAERSPRREVVPVRQLWVRGLTMLDTRRGCQRPQSLPLPN